MLRSYDFDDILIRPTPSDVSSRDDVDISVRLQEGLTLNFPLVVSPMVGVVNGAFAKQVSDLGGMAILHRFYESRQSLLSDILSNLVCGRDTFGLSIRIDEENFEELISLSSPNFVLIDTANGYTSRLLRFAERVASFISANGLKILLGSGNVVTKEGCHNLYDAGCDIIRVGLGSGSVCTTRGQTGMGIPNITALMDCADMIFEEGRLIRRTFPKYKIMIDGGIRNPGDFVKAIVAGADLGMSGKLFGQCYEAPNKGTLYGMASRTHMKNTNTSIKSVEGIDIPIEKRYSLEQFVREFGYGIKSAGTYLDASNLNEIRMNGEFIQVGDSAIKKNI